MYCTYNLDDVGHSDFVKIHDLLKGENVNIGNDEFRVSLSNVFEGKCPFEITDLNHSFFGDVYDFKISYAPLNSSCEHYDTPAKIQIASKTLDDFLNKMRFPQ